MYRNSFDKTGQCSQMGQAAESSFSGLLATRGSVREASTPEQMQHVDFILTTNGQEIKYEVKARKKVMRGHAQATDETVWIEFLNVRGDLGWLYGKAHYIAFERADDFVIVNREKLIEMAEAKCQLQQKVSSAGQALYRGYTRYGRNDLVSMVYMTDIESIAHEIWQK